MSSSCVLFEKNVTVKGGIFGNERCTDATRKILCRVKSMSCSALCRVYRLYDCHVALYGFVEVRVLRQIN